MNFLSTPVSLVIPTYRRDQVLVDTIEYLLAMQPAPDEILIVDQLPAHTSEVTAFLLSQEKERKIRWLRLDAASIPRAMNVGLGEAKSEIVLFVDDDIVPVKGLLAEHLKAHRSEVVDVVVGRVIQPWGPAALESEWLKSTDINEGGYRRVTEFMGGNFSIRRDGARELGGFDENFVGAAYRFEAEFASRVRAAGGKILFAPKAQIRHLRVSSGGTRAYGSHQRTLRPYHTVGDYYYLLRGIDVPKRFRRIVFRPFRSIATRFHLRHPWWIPLTLTAEITGLMWAVLLVLQGPSYLRKPPASNM